MQSHLTVLVVLCKETLIHHHHLELTMNFVFGDPGRYHRVLCATQAASYCKPTPPSFVCVGISTLWSRFAEPAQHPDMIAAITDIWMGGRWARLRESLRPTWPFGAVCGLRYTQPYGRRAIGDIHDAAPYSGMAEERIQGLQSEACKVR